MGTKRQGKATRAVSLWRLVTVGGLLGAAFLVLLVRLFWVQVHQHELLMEDAAGQHFSREVVEPHRGSILDRYGRTLVHTLRHRSLVAELSLVRQPTRTAASLARVLNQGPEDLAAMLGAGGGKVIVAAGISEEEARAIDRLELPGVRVHGPGTRVQLVSGFDLLGAVDWRGRGVEGLERRLDRELSGRSGWRTQLRDAAGTPIEPFPIDAQHPAEDGLALVLTIDARLQWMVENVLADSVREFEARRGSVVMVDVHTGEVLALAGSGDQVSPGRRIARLAAVEDLFEPGSTFKIVPFAAALETGEMTDDSVYFAHQGSADLGGFTIRDVKKMGWLCAADVFAHSSNVATAKIGQELGADLLHQYVRAFGFGQRTGIQLPGEQAGLVRGVHDWSGRSTATVAIGQEVSVTAMQLAMAYACVASGGELLEPTLVKELRRGDGAVVHRHQRQVVRRVMSAANAQTLRGYAERCVAFGSGRRADPGVLSVAGKTGTAQKAAVDGTGYAEGVYVSCFAGFFPAQDPQVAIVAIIDEPGGARYYGGEVAAPVFAEIARQTASIAAGSTAEEPLAILHAVEPTQVQVPDVRRHALADATERVLACGLKPTVVVEGARVVAQDPSPGTWVALGEPVVLDCQSGGPSEVPDVTGLTLREAHRQTRFAGLELRAVGEGGLVVAQDPPPGSPAPPGRSFRVVLAQGGRQ